MTDIRGEIKAKHQRPHWKTRVSPIVLGISPAQLARLDSGNATAVLRNAANQLLDVADELDGGV